MQYDVFRKSAGRRSSSSSTAVYFWPDAAWPGDVSVRLRQQPKKEHDNIPLFTRCNEGTNGYVLRGVVWPYEWAYTALQKHFLTVTDEDARWMCREHLFSMDWKHCVSSRPAGTSNVMHQLNMISKSHFPFRTHIHAPCVTHSQRPAARINVSRTHK